MALDKLNDFLARAAENPDLMTSLTQALEGSKDPQDLVSLGARHGFEFSPGEVEYYFKGLLSAEAPGELSDEDLEHVSGGKDIHYKPDNRLQLVSRFSAGFSSLPTWMGKLDGL